MRLTIAFCAILFFTAAPSDADTRKCGNNIRNNDASSVYVDCSQTTGVPQETFTKLVNLLAEGAGDQPELIASLKDLLPETARVNSEALAQFFGILKEDQVPADQLAARLEELAYRHIELIDELAAFRVADPEIQQLIDDASAALAMSPPDHDTARAKLAEARALRKTRREAAEAILNEQRREEAAIARQQAELEASVLNRLQAAQLYFEAADLLPQDDKEAIWSDLFSAADNLYNHGRLKGDNQSLVTSIETWRRMRYLRPRSVDVDDWAKSQDRLGISLSALGAQTGSSNEIWEAINIFVAADEFTNSERDQKTWAERQNNLATAYMELGKLEADNAHLGNAIAAYEAALGVFSADEHVERAANIRSNLGAALLTLARRTGNSDLLYQAIEELQTAAELTSNERMSYLWVNSTINLASALMVKAELNRSVVDLRAAHDAYKASLEVIRKDTNLTTWANAQIGISAAGTRLFMYTADRKHADTVIERAESALAFINSDHTPIIWSQLRMNAGQAKLLLAQSLTTPESSQLLASALSDLRAAVVVVNLNEAPMQWSRAQFNLAEGLLAKYQMTGTPSDLSHARQSFEDTREVFEVVAPEFVGRVDYYLDIIKDFASDKR